MDIPTLEREAKSLVYAARLKGELDQLTPAMVRQALETKFSLEHESLKADMYWMPLKSAIKAAATEEIPDPTEIPIKKTQKRKAEETADSRSTKKQDSRRSKPKKGPKDFKSSETVESSDMEDSGDHEMNGTFVEPEKRAAVERPKPPSRDNEGMSSSKLKKSSVYKDSGSGTKPSPRPSKLSAPEAAEDSASEISVLEDEPVPRKKGKTSKTTESRDTGGEKSKGKKGAELSKEEETIKRLKSLVLACGVRKAWAKVFKDVDKPSQQIRMLKEILADLGMSGRMSLEQAKAIKEKRELAQELEDVQAFAAATKSKPVKPTEEDSGSDESEEEALPAKRKTNARQSIMAFLGDQSDDD